MFSMKNDLKQLQGTFFLLLTSPDFSAASSSDCDTRNSFKFMRLDYKFQPETVQTAA